MCQNVICKKKIDLFYVWGDSNFDYVIWLGRPRGNELL